MRLIDADKLISEQDVYFDGNRTAKDIIDEQPTVQQWIPVSERLPNENEIKKDEGCFMVQSDTGERFTCNFDSLANGYDNPLWCCNVQIVAWMSLPDRYRPQ